MLDETFFSLVEVNFELVKLLDGLQTGYKIRTMDYVVKKGAHLF